MNTILLIAFSVAIQLVPVVLSMRLLRVARSRKSWVIMAIAFFLMTLKRVTDLFFFLLENNYEIHLQSYFLDIIISILFIIALVSIERILTLLKHSQEELMGSEKRFKTIFDNSSDEVFIADFDGNILEVNNEACRKLGYTREELIQMNFQDIKTPKYINLVKPNIEIIRRNGKHIYESEHWTKDKKVLSLEMSSRVVEYEGGQRILTIAHDITEQREFERKILKANLETEERERKRFAKEMHDGLGPLLSTIKLYANELASDEIEKDEKEKFIKYTNELIDEAISNIRTISDNLTPRVITDYGLVKAIESLAKKIQATGKIKIHFRSENYTVRLDSGLEIVFYRITEELINNTLKHAKASNISILLTIEYNSLKLDYTDDGTGFIFDDVFMSSKAGMGLKNIISRVKSVNANYLFGNNDGKGFLFKADVEIK